MILPKTIEIIVFLCCALIIYQKKKDYILNKTYSIALCGWSIYVILDALLFPIAHLESTAPPLIANILRDIAICAGGILAFGFLYASIIIRYGEALAKEIRTVILMVAGYLALVIPTVITDAIIKEAGNVHTDFNISNGITILAQIIIYFIAVYQLIVNYRVIQDEKIKKRILYFIFGALLIALGIIFFIIVGVTASEFDFITGPIGHFIWILAPVFILLGVRKIE